MLNNPINHTKFILPVTRFSLTICSIHGFHIDNSTVKKVIIIVNQFLTKIMSHISCTASLCCMQAVTCERSEHNGHHNVEDFSAPEIESLALCHLLLSVMLAIGQ